jgi:hypothetical protein
MMENNTTKRFRGWSNYATFTVFHDVLSDLKFDNRVSAEEVEEITLKTLFEGYEMHSGSHLIEEYARMMMELVDFEDIAKTINAEMKNIK